MSNKNNKQSDSDSLVPDAKVRAEFSVTPMSLFRWDRDPQMAAKGWPPAITIRKRKYRSRRALEVFKTGMMTEALRERGRRRRGHDDE